MRDDLKDCIRAARIRVPASTSNLGSAFDAVGLALRLYLSLEVCELREGPSRIEYSGQDEQTIPNDKGNLIWQVMEEAAATQARQLPPFILRVNNQIPIAKGLGSSASACLGACACANFLCNLGWFESDLLELAAAKEGHPDNVAPALFGGLVASVSAKKILCSRSEFPSRWTIVTVTPDFALQTKHARAVLPAEVPHRHAVFNVQRAAFLMAQLVQGRREGIREAMADMLHQPYRSPLIPGLGEILSIE
jgi:homoserine kinase